MGSRTNRTIRRQTLASESRGLTCQTPKTRKRENAAASPPTLAKKSEFPFAKVHMSAILEIRSVRRVKDCGWPRGSLQPDAAKSIHAQTRHVATACSRSSSLNRIEDDDSRFKGQVKNGQCDSLAEKGKGGTAGGIILQLRVALCLIDT